MGRPDVYLATCSELPYGDPDTKVLARHLRASGVSPEVAVWSDTSVDWSAASLTVIRSTWDYHLRREEFLSWARSVPALQNPVPLVEWNTDKRYLLGLPSEVPVIPSRVLDHPFPSEIERTLEEMEWDTAVLKPTVGLDGHAVERVRRGEVPKQSRRGQWLLQPFVAEVAASGEVSIAVIDGEPTHAVLRRPPVDDFRAQERLGGWVEAHEAPEAFTALARRVVEGLEATPLYARVDVVAYHGAPVLMELELVEPSLFFEFGVEGLEAMVGAIRARLERSSS